MISGNKGEWSELYVLLRLLESGKLYAADENKRRIDNVYYPIVKVLREHESCGNLAFVLPDDNKNVDLYINDKKVSSVSRTQLRKSADYLLCEINDGTGSFSIDGADDILDTLHCSKIKAPSEDKTDIKLAIYDNTIGYTQVCGFSIKSDLGNAPTLLNAGKTTNFIYQISGIDSSAITIINSLPKMRDRLTYIAKHGGIIRYIRPANRIFDRNLSYIDSTFDKVIANALFYYYKFGKTTVEDIVKMLEDDNPLDYDNISLYSYKFEKFLCSVALGMKPATPWNGHEEANGGYIIVKTNGDVLAYHIYNRDFFEDYLLKNTRLETASLSRHEFGSIYSVGNEKYINLNLQIRFI